MDWALQIADGSVVITETPTTGNIQVSTLTVGDIVLTGTATGNFAAGGGTTVIGTSPISVATSGSTATVSLNANYSTTSHLHDGTYQPFGTYITSITGTAPITASGTTAITVGINQAAITANSATNAEVLRAYVKNTTGTTIPKGSAVYISGSTGDNALISLASATAEVSSSKTLGLTASAIANDGFGYVIENGLLVGIDTSAATAGQAVWLGNTPGSFVFGSPPAEPSHSVYLGVVIRVQSNNGEILVKVQNGYELDELHDVSVGSPTDGDIVQWKSSSSLWTKASIANAGIAASVHTHPYQPSGTYITAVNGTAPITASTNTAGVVTVGLSASYASAVHTHDTSSITSGNFVASLQAGTGVTVTGADANNAAKTVSIGQAVATNSNVTFNQVTASNLLTTSSGLASIANATGTATTISSTTATAPTDISGLQFVFTPTYNEDVTLNANLVYTQSAASSATIDIITRVIVNGTIVTPQGGFVRLAANHSSPTGLTSGVSHTFAAVSGTPYTAKVAVYKTAALGTYTASNISSFTITRVRE